MSDEKVEEEIKMIEIRHCNVCGGDGDNYNTICEHCDGTGHIIGMKNWVQL